METSYTNEQLQEAMIKAVRELRKKELEAIEIDIRVKQQELETVSESSNNRKSNNCSLKIKNHVTTNNQ